MREIKFRAWDKVNNRWFYFTLKDTLRIGWKEKIELLKIDLDNSYQFTGLKDKNGVEIYESDIVKYRTKNFEYIDIIEFIGSCFCIGNENTGFTTIDDYLVKEIEVIGNIYENPDLLTPPTK